MKPHGKVLLVEDDLGMQKIVQAVIAPRCDLTCVGTLTGAQGEIEDSEYALLILDVHLPDGDGFSFCRQVRANPKFNDLQIIFLTGHGDKEHKVHGFSLGADDYVVKPIEPMEFIARVEARLNIKQRTKVQTNFQAAGFRVDLISQRVYRSEASGTERALELTPIEFRLFVHFLSNEGKIFSRENLLQAIWGGAVSVSTHTIDTHISSLRKKLGDVGRLLRNVLKKGYCFSADEDR